MLKGNVFKNQIFENHIFALFISLFLNKKDGIARDYKNAMNVTYSGHSVTVNSGACIIQGRPLEEDSSTTIDAGIETMFCKLVVEIDLDKVNTSSVFNQGYYNIVKSESAYPNLTQQDIVGLNSGKYQYELARFKISDGVVADFEDKRTYIEEQLQYDSIATLFTRTTNLSNDIATKAPTNHTVNATTYGLGEAWKYGHCRVVDGLNKSTFENGEALSAHQGFVLDKKIDTRYDSITTTMQGLEQRVSALERR